MDDNYQPTEKKDILFVSTECTPFCAHGELADFCAALPKYLARNENVNIKVVLPYYSCIPKEFSDSFELMGERTVDLTWRNEYCGIYEYEYQGITYYFIDNKQYFDREKLYGYADDVERFSFFSKAVLDMLPIINFFPDIIHTNDWQTGLVSVFLKVLVWQNPKYEHIKCVHTLHNIAYQGKCDFNVVHDLLDVEDKFAYLFDFFGSANILKASIECADQIVTVSESYKNEILTPEGGCGLDNVLNNNLHKLSAITGGVDYEKFNPENDSNIYATYTKNGLKKRLTNKTGLQKELGLIVDENLPLYSFVGFMENGKGIDLISTVISRVVENGAEFVAVGCGNPEFENFFVKLSEKYPERVKACIGYNTTLPHKIYAASDFLFSLAQTEPLGITPLIANKYGCLPIVYATGGIKDNFINFKNGAGNGYMLKNYDAESLDEIVNRTLRHFKDKEKLSAFIKSAMEQDFDIENTADEYIDLYEEM